MFRKIDSRPVAASLAPERVDSVLGAGITWQGVLGGSGGVRIEGAFDGDIELRGMVVVDEQGRVTCDHIIAVSVVVAGSVKGNVTAQRVEITATGRVWGDVVTTSFSTEEGAFLRGQIRMEDEISLPFGTSAPESEQDTDSQD